MSQSKSGRLGLCVASSIFFVGLPAQAQNSVAAPTVALEEIVVTARKTEESLMEVPLSITAVSAANIEAANIKDARTIILASQNDAMNLQIALKARSMNPKIQVVIRIFDEDFAHALQEQFGFTALSATEMAAPVFAAIFHPMMSPVEFFHGTKPCFAAADTMASGEIFVGK